MSHTPESFYDIAQLDVGSIILPSQTVSAMTSFFHLMSTHPDIQKRAQAEIDHAAAGRLPTLDDQKVMPYVRAMVKEIIRWGPIAPLGRSLSIFVLPFALRSSIPIFMPVFRTASPVDGR